MNCRTLDVAIDAKIKTVRGFALSSPYGKGQSFGQPKSVKSVGFVEIVTDSRVKGIGETYAGVYAPELIAPSVKYFEPFLVGRKVGDQTIVQQLAQTPFIGRNGLLRSVTSAIDIALWDLRGKLLGKPVYHLLGGSNRAIRPYASGGSVVLSPSEIQQDVKALLVQGFDAYKMRVGRQSWVSDLKRVAAARETLGERMLMVDAIMGTLRPPWDAKTATGKARDL